MQSLPRTIALTLLLACGLAAGASPQIERLDLTRMIERTDGAVFAEVVSRKVFRVDHPVDGPELYFTSLRLSGNSLRDGGTRVVDVVYPGGFLDPEHGVYNSEAPAAEDVRAGSQVVAFYKAVEDLGGGVSGNALYASHGGLYRTVEGPKGRVVLGRGEGYAVRFNRKLDDLETAVRKVLQQLEQAR